ncbi:hypothetical protein [Methylobacterium gossipiicola]|uniref:Uncharacterized protein n=1 Tax=Methylobacterium gossipiicola TaxID=582675 RepID=A0A1I2W223_9HYPH|nr:hypothetical protein [Methylobacterium gossipiicola]SFG95413.1 hypothetical protein SAMN05192565_11931 [Methylobacterium gossipiicola]
MIPSKGRPLLRWATGASACVLVLLGAGLPERSGVAWAQEAASAVQDVTLTDVSLPLGDTVLKAPRVTVSGTRLSKDDLLALLRPGPEPVAARLARLDAASLVIPELRFEGAVKGTRDSVTYSNVIAKDVRAGRIADLTATGAILTVEGERKGAGSYGPLQATDLDLTALARLYAESGDGKGALQRIYGAFSLSDLAFVDTNGTAVKFARIQGRDLSARPVPGGWAGALATLTAPGLAEAPPATRAKASATAADLAEAVTLGSFEATGLSVQHTKGPSPLDLGIARIRSGGSEASLEDITLTSGGVTAKVARLSLNGFSLAPTIAALRTFAAKPDATDDDLRLLTPTIGTLSLSDLSLDLPRDPAVPDPLVQNPAGKTAPMHIGLRTAAMNFGPPRDGVPTAGRIDLTGLTLPASAVAGIPGLGSLGLYGYGDLDLTAVADTSWDAATKELKFGEISISGKDMGTVRINGLLGGIGPEVFDTDPGVSGFAMLSATAKALDVTIENTGLFERFIAAQSKVLSLKPEELKQEYATASLYGVPAILGNAAGAKAIGTAMSQFVAKPGSLSLHIRPKNGTGIGMLEFSAAPTPAAVLDRLTVDAKAN